MTLTTLYHDGTQNTAGGLLRHTQVDWINMYRMQLCPLSTGAHGGFSMHRAHLPSYDATKQFTWRHNLEYYSPQHRSDPSNFDFQRVS